MFEASLGVNIVVLKFGTDVSREIYCEKNSVNIRAFLGLGGQKTYTN